MIVSEVPLFESFKALRARLSLSAVVLIILFAISGFIQRLGPTESLVVGHKKAAFTLDENVVGTRAGSGLVFGILGGFRTLVADIMWLRMQEAWIDDDLAETEALIRLTVMVDPRPFVFWQAGAHTLVFDMPFWRIRDGGGESVVPRSIQNRIRHEQTLRGVNFLKEGAALYPDNPEFLIEIGKMYLNGIQDYNKTIEYFRRAWKMPNRPYYIGRLLARVLERAGQTHEALAVLYEDYESLPKDDPDAYIPLVLEQIAELESSLGIR